MAIYTGITIGPISDTMSLTTSPAGTWCASYLFSRIAKNLIVGLVEKGICAESFITPAFEIDAVGKSLVIPECNEILPLGIGVLHDHIIFEGDGLAAANEVITQVIRKTSDEIANIITMNANEAYSYLSQFLRIYTAILDVPADKNPIVAFGPVLSALELEPNFPASELQNPLLTLFEAEATDRNRFLKRYADLFGPDWVLYGKDRSSILDLEHIACRDGKHAALKKSELYYCVLTADGDSMGTMFESLTAAKIRKASKNCLAFCQAATKLILAYGGVPIYAGGDDLLAFVPVTGKLDESSVTVLALAQKLSDVFNEQFPEERERLNGKPSLSIGVAIQYYRSPLFEAMERSYQMLGAAKKSSEAKNGLCVNLMKHSGQSLIYSIAPMTDRKSLTDLDELIQSARSIGSKDDNVIFAASIGHHMESFKNLLRLGIRDRLYMDPAGAAGDMLGNYFEFMFDNDGQRAYGGYIKKIMMYCRTATEEQQPFFHAEAGKATKDEEKKEIEDRYLDEILQQILYSMRLLRFMVEEKGGNM